jgi:hypothetical protein
MGMNDSQLLTVALSVIPTMLTVLVGILVNNARLSDLRNDMTQRFNMVDRRFDLMQAEMNRRFDDSRDMWRSELHRVEDILDARLKHIEER